MFNQTKIIMKLQIRYPGRAKVVWLTFALILMLISRISFGQSNQLKVQDKETLAILSITSKNITADAATARNILQLEVEKTNVFSVMDKYDIQDIITESGKEFKNCYGKSCLIEVGEILKADIMLTGNIERFGEKIIITLRLINVHTESTVKVQVGEYINLQEELQKMIMITVNNLLDIKNDENLVNLLVDYDGPIASPKTTLNLNGPRMGISYTIGDAAERLQASKSDGGYEMFPVITQFGYQFETQYLSAGSFQALLEVIGLVGGLESGKFIPSISLLNGFRSSANGWEFAFGPTFKVVKTATGFYDENGDWHLEYEWDPNSGENPYELQELPDNRGSVKVSTNLVLAVGKTFKSGYLNIPINVYVVPNKKGTIVGTSIGFNIGRKKKK
jgi:TolB-like protein